MNVLILKVLIGIAITLGVIASLILRRAETERRDAHTLREMRGSMSQPVEVPASNPSSTEDWVRMAQQP